MYQEDIFFLELKIECVALLASINIVVRLWQLTQREPLGNWAQMTKI